MISNISKYLCTAIPGGTWWYLTAVIPAPGRTSHKDHKFNVSVSSTCGPCHVWVSANPRASRVINGLCEAERKSSTI